MNFKKTNISFEETGQFSKAFTDYVNGTLSLLPFYEHRPNIEGFRKAIEAQAGNTINRELLVKVLEKNYGNLASESTAKNIKLLGEKNTFTVTTGHQLCLFTGPLYFIYKIVTAINLAQQLKKEFPQYNFVPVYWMASEDHDFAEINHAYLFGKKIEWSGDSISGGPVGKMPVHTLAPVLDGLYTIMGDSANATELKKIIAESYSGNKTLAEATFAFVNALFGKYGMVILDADNAELKKQFLPVITDELTKQSSFRLVSDTNARLIATGVEPQVHAREINLFYINDQGRNRIEKQGDKYVVVNTVLTFTAEQVISETKNHTERFSPNVLLRPVYQQTILPNIAYIGGPAEIVYWLQLKTTFEYHKAVFPILMPRNFAMVIDKPTASKLDKFRISEKNIFNEADELIRNYVAANDGAINFEEEKNKLKKVYDELGEKVKGIDSTLTSSVEAELQKQYNALKVLETKLVRAQKQKDETSVNQIKKIKEKLFPEGSLQERHENFIPFYLQYGSTFMEMLLNNLNPLNFTMAVLKEE